MQRVVSRPWLTLLDHLFLLRPMLMPPVWTIGLLGYGQGQRQVSESELLQTLLPIAIFTLLTGGVYVQNQIYDLEGDRANHKLFLLTGGYISTRAAQIQTFVCYSAAVLFAFFHSGWLGIMMGTALVMGFQYNAPPLRWKDRPIEGLLYNVVVYGVIAFAVGWMSVAPLSVWMGMHALPICLGVVAIYLNTTLPDIPGDRLAGKTTIGVKYGFKPTSYMACVALAGAIVIGFWLGDWFITGPSILCLPFFIRMASTGDLADVARATKAGVLALSLAAVVVCPPYLVVLIVLYFGSKPYYKYRFGINYPSFRVQR